MSHHFPYSIWKYEEVSQLYLWKFLAATHAMLEPLHI